MSIGFAPLLLSKSGLYQNLVDLERQKNTMTANSGSQPTDTPFTPRQSSHLQMASNGTEELGTYLIFDIPFFSLFPFANEF